MIRFNNVSKTFGQTKVLQEQTFQINDREFFCAGWSQRIGENHTFKND